jgi:CheY-like chemotaxis protein
MHSLPQDADDTQAALLFVSGDLFFAGKVTSTAGELGLRVDIEGNLDRARTIAREAGYRCVILDLQTPGLVVADFVDALPEQNRPAVIAFAAHVRADLLEEARRGGCDEVMPRSKFSATLPALLRRSLDD